jgi:hypothetical protein
VVGTPVAAQPAPVELAVTPLDTAPAPHEARVVMAAAAPAATPVAPPEPVEVLAAAIEGAPPVKVKAPPEPADVAPTPMKLAALRRRSRSHVHRCRQCGHESRHDGTCAIATVTDLLQCPVCDAARSRPPRTRHAIAAAIAGLALLPVLWWFDAVPWRSDQGARGPSSVREAEVRRGGLSPSTEDRLAQDSTATPSSTEAPGVPAVESREESSGETTQPENRSTPPRPPLARPPSGDSRTARGDGDASREPTPPPAARVERPGVPAPPVAARERVVPPPPPRPEAPRRAAPDSRLAESRPIPAPDPSAARTSRSVAPPDPGTVVAPSGRTGNAASSPAGPTVARPTPGPEDRPQAPPSAPVPSPGSAVATAPAPALDGRASVPSPSAPPSPLASSDKPTAVAPPPSEKPVVGAPPVGRAPGAPAPAVFTGVSMVTRTTGSQTSVPARSSACMRTSGVSFRKSAAVLSGPRRDGGPSGTL